MAMESINPATEEVMASYEEYSRAQIDDALDAAASGFTGWRQQSFAARGVLMGHAGAYLRQHKDRFARLITVEMGKPITQAEAEIEKCARNCDFYAENAEQMLANRAVTTNAKESYVAFDPIGPVLAVMPWNFPFWQVFRFAAPALMAGNVALLKHASNVPQCALAIEEVFQESGFPAGAFRTLLASGAATEDIISDERVRAVTLTGSDATGSKVAEAAGRHLKKTVLELGGSDPFIVLADADLRAAAEVGAQARYQNTGQSCIAAKRFIVEESVAGEYERRYVEAAGKLRVGNPLERETQVGPLAREDLLDQLERQVRESVKQGARLLIGGHRLDGPGYFFAPTVLADVSPTMPAHREETFGPVAALMRAPSPEAAVAMANDSPYGLGATIWTSDVARGQRLARGIEAGSVFINGMVASDPRLPFGGVKHSGYGRELSDFGIHEFVNIKTIWIGPAR